MKWVGPLKMLPKQCVWCSKNGHQTGAIKPLSAEKKKVEGDRLWVPHPVPLTHLPPIKEAGALEQ